ncbi:UTRA domain-containing protein [Corynebacterium caspium]|uniref:UTRA domain-containing protein n=1 Tax=Corynebacterium caspium TaxID=234828 RepID=UPI00035D9B20|nr:UTRA domain-containing protein [Corynebacterium caspium]
MRYFDETPLCVQHSYYPKNLCESLSKDDLLANNFDFLESGCNKTIVHRVDSVMPAVAAEMEQQQLGITRTDPVLKIVAVSSTADGEVVEYSEDILRSDILRITVVTQDFADRHVVEETALADS